jgi:NADH-quinone oxidoreductase subunit N
MIFVALEMTSLSLYILTAFNKRSVASAEAALKYFLFGGMSAAFTLFGLSLLYGLTGSTNLREIAAALGTGAAGARGLDPMLTVALVMVVIGLGFKIAAAPLHLWAPDTYEGAPAPSAAFIASASKVASFYIFAKVLIVGFAGAEGLVNFPHYAAGWTPVIAVLAVASMVVGNLAAIVQSNVRRLIAYSAVAHAGYALLAVLAGAPGQPALIYYVLTYGLTTVGAFGVVAVVERSGGGANLGDFAGLSRRAPLLSFCMLVFMLSLAGIPPLAGFFGKFYVFSSVVSVSPGDLRMLWLVVLAVAMSAVSLYYYLQVLKQAYVSGPPVEAGAMKVPVTSLLAVVLLAALVILLGCAPTLLLSHVTEATGAAAGSKLGLLLAL